MGACRNGLFREINDDEELHNLFNEIASSFRSVRDNASVESTFHGSISAIMSRFFPKMKMGEILAFVEATPGYDAFLKDFPITNSAKSSDNIYLFVAQTDNTETSSCLITPQLANILLNGSAVDRRTCVDKDPGPQAPTLVTHMLTYGTNLLQALGQFDGKYFIAVAFMSMISNPNYPALVDYAPPPAAPVAPDSDNDIIQGPSKISLNCPISFARIKTPVKGQICKHLQCFDFDNYVDKNSSRPSWRCPYCSQSVCFDDIRVDQSMSTILKEVGVNVSHVKIYAGGWWEAIHDHTDKPSLHQESTTSQEEDEIDRKFYLAQLQDHSSHVKISKRLSNEMMTPGMRIPIVVQTLPVIGTNRVHNDLSHVSSQLVQQFGVRSGPPQQSSDHSNSHQYQSLHPMIPNSVRAPAPQVHQGVVANQQAHQSHMAATIQIRSQTPSFLAPVQTSGSSSMHVASLEEQREQNWRPTGRMRGSLSGRAYSDALNQSITLPTQHVQAARPPVLNTPRPVIPPHLQGLMENRLGKDGPGKKDSNMESR